MFAGMTLTHLLLAAGALLLFASAMAGLEALNRWTTARDEDHHAGVDESGLADLIALAPADDLAHPHEDAGLNVSTSPRWPATSATSWPSTHTT